MELGFGRRRRAERAGGGAGGGGGGSAAAGGDRTDTPKHRQVPRRGGRRRRRPRSPRPDPRRRHLPLLRRACPPLVCSAGRPLPAQSAAAKVTVPASRSWPTWMFCCARFPRMDTGCCSVIATIARHSVPSCTITNAFSGISANVKSGVKSELQRQVRTRLFGSLPAGCTQEVIQDQ
uniref:Uncharacterized protein n=1 Tax=Oryza glumipatula TaxID=40148 RepID=A0A0E0BB48_9ORYZ